MSGLRDHGISKYGTCEVGPKGAPLQVALGISWYSYNTLLVFFLWCMPICMKSLFEVRHIFHAEPLLSNLAF